MHPFTAGRLIEVMPPGPVADPFMGGGTVMLEAMLAGRLGIGTDINAVGVEVAWARTRRWSRPKRAALVSAAAEVVAKAKPLRAGGRVDRATFEHDGPWFDPPALLAVWSLAKVLHEGAGRWPTSVRRMLRVCLSSILVKASKQASDSVVVADRDHKWITDKRVDQWFVARAEEHARNLADLYDGLTRREAEGAALCPPLIAQEDARTPWGSLASEDVPPWRASSARPLTRACTTTPPTTSGATSSLGSMGPWPSAPSSGRAASSGRPASATPTRATPRAWPTC